MASDEYFQRTLENAERLWSDSKFLNDEARSRSAIILAIFAIEELGKALITKWGVRNLASKREHPTHVEKQTATFALLSADEILKKDRVRVRKHIERGTFDFLKIGPMSHQFAWARGGFFDDVRMAATYADKEPKIPDDLTDSIDTNLVDELHRWFRNAVAASKNQEAMSLAAAFYQNGLGRL
ncbi:MAG: AbiV family abortive infection protein [Pseudomonadota bacterium]|jgi:AbiV family abortive infection protein|uniref:AbiV family abortive infection protein n=1 Tax=Sphingobium yanoikuyae TaxID=13690 RepID=UPI0013771A30|nr:AbiV family abortive infection protein [Sphingobium yanoikuyae]NBB38387.1 AbiV family abortive infection protein [Sphingobium yanoikuyae]